MNKKGLSDVVTTVLIILLVMISISVLWFFVKPLIDNALGNYDPALLTISLEIEKSSVKVIPAEKSVSLIVKRGAGEGNLTGVNLVFYSSTGESKVYYVDYSNGAFKELESKKIIGSYLTTGLDNVVKIDLAPVIVSSKGKRLIGDVRDSYVLRDKDIAVDAPVCNEIDMCQVYECGSYIRCGDSTTCPYNCGSNQICNENHQCVDRPACIPTCSGNSCGQSDGCGGICNGCSNTSESCNLSLSPPSCVANPCIPSCVGKICGQSAGCGITCNNCGQGFYCNTDPVPASSWYCAAICNGDCTGKECGDDGCGYSCGTCTGTTRCDESTWMCVEGSDGY